MKHGDYSGKAVTVLGPVDGGSLGVTMVHEHLLNDHTIFYSEPEDEAERRLSREPLNLGNLYRARLNPFGIRENLVRDDIDMAVAEAQMFASFGGRTIVEMTTVGAIGRDPRGLAEIARRTGLNIVMGTGYYMVGYRPPELESLAEQQITDGLVRDIVEGVDGTDIRAGVLGEIGCNAPLTEMERKVLRCCAAAQQETGVAISIHPGPTDEAGWEIVQVLREAGADLGRVVIGHVDLLNFTVETRRRIMDAGCYIAFDNFGNEGAFHIPDIDRLFENVDFNRVGDIVGLVKAGYRERILVSQDVGTRDRLTCYGGTGLAHILRDIVPLMREKGLTDDDIHTLLVDNPRRLITVP